MADFGRWTPEGGDPSVPDVHRTDAFLDSLATGQPVYANDPGEAELAYLLAGWRDGARDTPMSAVLTEQDAVAALQRGTTMSRPGGPPRRRRRMSLTVLGSTAAAVLCLGGFGAIVAGAGPEDPLYGLRTALFGEQQVTRDDPVVLAAQTELAEVQELIERGDWDAAQQRLQAVTTTVATVDNEQRKQELVGQWQALSVKVESRDADATVPPDAPPVTLPVLPPVDQSVTTTSPTEPTTTAEEVPPDETSPTAPTTPTTPTSPTAPPTEEPPSEPTPTSVPGTEPTSVPGAPPPTSVAGIEPTSVPVEPTTSPPPGTTATTTTAVSAPREEAASGGESDAVRAPTPEAEVTVPEQAAESAPAAPTTTTAVTLPTSSADGAGRSSE